MRSSSALSCLPLSAFQDHLASINNCSSNHQLIQSFCCLFGLLALQVEGNMMRSHSSSSSMLERKTVEKNRRMLMKSLCFKLASLLPSHYSKRRDTVQDQVEKATGHIRMLQEKLQVLKEKRAVLAAAHNMGIDNDVRGGMMMGLRLPVVEVRDSGSAVQVVLITGSDNKYFTLSDIITVIEEGGAQVVNASSSCEANKVFYIIHSQVTSSRVGFDSAKVNERLKELINWS